MPNRAAIAFAVEIIIRIVEFDSD